jgi:hypothetical protein
VPGPVEDLFLEACLHSIKVNWKKPTVNSYCVSHYVIDWLQIQNGKNHSSIISPWYDSFVIENLESYEKYQVSVRAVNEIGDSSVAVSNNIKLTDGKYKKYYVVLFVICVRIN